MRSDTSLCAGPAWRQLGTLPRLPGAYREPCCNRAPMWQPPRCHAWWHAALRAAPTRGPSAGPRVRRQRFELSTPSPRARGTPQQPPHTASPPSSADRKAGRITFDMSGGWKQAKLAGRRPLDGRVRPHCAGKAPTKAPPRACLGGSAAATGCRSSAKRMIEGCVSPGCHPNGGAPSDK